MGHFSIDNIVITSGDTTLLQQLIPYNYLSNDVFGVSVSTELTKLIIEASHFFW